MKKLTLILSAGTCLITPATAQADNPKFGVNYDGISFLEEPLARELGSVTLSTRALIDQSIEYDTTDEKDRYNTRVNADIRLETQLPNTWQAGVQYFIDFNRLNGNNREKYEDGLVLFLSDELGTVAVGNVTNAVVENTRRMRSVGHGSLANRAFFGNLDETGGFYSVRLNSYVFSLTGDQEGRAEGAVSYERNVGKYNILLSTRVRKGEVSENRNIENVGNNAVISESGDTFGAAAGGSFRYSSFMFDGEVGYETVDTDQGNDKNDHPFASVGISYKVRALSVSAEGGISQYDDQDLRSVALGGRYDIARGLSFNMGVNYTFVEDNDKTKAIGSFRYEF